ncbi:SHOCT domain-containing protein [Terrabacter sp. BE26]|uniref:SHOCT domain-containing protein n=1 Tax=Terrabacter sp. BE26 TaxID=2898152 RepID=UPI0035BE8BD1
MDFWSYFWLLVWTFLFVAYLMVLFRILGDLFRDRDLGGFAKVVWVVALIVFPLLASLVYLMVRGRGMAERTMERALRRTDARDAYVRSVAGSNSSTPVDQLTKAKSLLDSGAITTEDFAQIKVRALA